MNPTILHILMSQEGIDTYGQAIEQQVLSSSMGATRVQWVNLASQPDATGHYPCDITYLTRDVTGASTKSVVLPALQRYYEILRASPQLAWAHTHSAGADRPIYAELMAKGVRVSTSSGANAAPVAHTAVAAVLALARQFPTVMQAQRDMLWKPLLGHPALHDLTGQTAMVVGLGPIGLQIGTFLQALGLKVIGVTRQVGAERNTTCCKKVLSLKDFHQGLPEADFLVLACPLTAQTRNLIDAPVLAQLKRGAYLVNVARGEVVVQDALVQALQTQQLGGAFLDVFEVEPLPPSSALWHMPQVMISAHSAGHFSGHGAQVLKIFLQNLQHYLRGEPFINQVTD